jgi:hypothetical protein
MAAASAAVRMLLDKSPFSQKYECEICGNIVDPARNGNQKSRSSNLRKE